ncbi:Schizosaccharomyces specific protein [Schizosaccharomyces osmophilus]|uniref:Schizosaccharomyces specific protein n=1 Tax=Schizosaccharomyces osmophilus TaxID=2545709 RepID=A0AAE9WFF7_9SCHI|nr:Schizosaccharomyces specific protein [Schizosaccharomyces osmophilus]WBW75314.1 Schizosaccharomyces specific protein [Schizosaccharomyces osmophilus]
MIVGKNLRLFRPQFVGFIPSTRSWFHNASVQQSILGRIKDMFGKEKEKGEEQVSQKDLPTLEVVFPKKRTNASKFEGQRLFEKFSGEKLNRADTLSIINSLRSSETFPSPWSPENRLLAAKLAYQKTGHIVYDSPLQEISNWDDMYRYYDIRVDYGDSTVRGRTTWKPTEELMLLPNVVLHIDKNGLPTEDQPTGEPVKTPESI